MTGTTRPCPPRRWASNLFPLFLISSLGILGGCFDGSDNDRQPSNPVPSLTSVSPTTAVAGGTGFTLTATGTGFMSGSVVLWNGASRSTTFVNSSTLNAAIPASDIAAAGTAQVTVVNPAPGGGTSSAVGFTIESPPPADNPVPAVTSMSPTTVLAGSAGFELSVRGSQFVTGASVRWNGGTRPTTFVSSTELRAAISAADVSTARSVGVAVVNPAPGGGTSGSLTFVVAAPPVTPAPVITSLDPATVVAGRPGFELLVTGSNFASGATVLWNGSDRVTTFVSSTQVKAAITASDVASPASVAVTVRNPAPDGGTSNALTLVVTAPPVTGALTPISVAPDGSPPNGPSLNGGMGIFGRVAVFASKASNLVPNDTNDAWDVFLRDTCLDYWTGGLLPGCTPSTTRISVAPDGSQANGDSGATAASPAGPVGVNYSGRYVAFVSSATNLVPGDTNGVDDVFLTDTCRDAWGRPIGGCSLATVRVSVRADGSQSSARASAPAIGDASGVVAFVSADPNLVAGDANGATDVFLRETCLGSPSGCTPGTRRVSVAAGGADANGPSGSPAFTGRYVAFVSEATNLVAGDTNGMMDVFMHDTCIEADVPCTPATERISMGNGGVQADGPSGEPLVGMPMSSAEGYEYHGRFVVFTSSASNLVQGDTNGVADVFMRDTCRGYPGCTPSTQRVSLTSDGQQIVGRASSQPGHMRWDGEEVLFVTAADGVVPDDTNGVEDVFMRGVCHDTPTCSRTTTRISVGDNGLQGNGPSTMPRGNHDAWVGPEWATFLSTASSFWPGGAPGTYSGAIFQATTY